MILISIDVGIRNLSFCLFKNEKIYKWDIINLTNDIPLFCCICNKKAKFMKPQSSECVCVRHSKQAGVKMSCDLKPTYIKKQNKQVLIDVCKKYKINVCENANKLQMIDAILEYSFLHCLVPLTNINAKETTLVTIGKNIIKHFDDILMQDIIDIVLIENQIGPLANKMKTIQGMLCQYFIMKNQNIQVETISSMNKLKDFVINKSEKQEYKDRKKMSISICNELISQTDNMWTSFFNVHKKKDDLADCYLQGIWYIKHKINNI